MVTKIFLFASGGIITLHVLLAQIEAIPGGIDRWIDAGLTIATLWIVLYYQENRRKKDVDHYRQEIKDQRARIQDLSDKLIDNDKKE